MAQQPGTIVTYVVSVITALIAAYAAWTNYKTNRKHPEVDIAAASLSVAQAERIKQELLTAVLQEARSDMERIRKERDELTVTNTGLKEQMDKLRQRVDIIELENQQLQHQIALLRQENQALKKRLDDNGFHAQASS